MPKIPLDSACLMVKISIYTTIKLGPPNYYDTVSTTFIFRESQKRPRTEPTFMTKIEPTSAPDSTTDRASALRRDTNREAHFAAPEERGAAHCDKRP